MNAQNSSQMSYANCLTLAWWKYWTGNYSAMSQALSDALAHSDSSDSSDTPGELITDWITQFTQISKAKGYSLNIQTFTERPEWQALLASTLQIKHANFNKAADTPQTQEPRFVLYRILGNDLPPRHYPGQTIDNLRFILNYEPPLHNCQKKWIVNKIVDLSQEQAILKVLDQTHQDYTHIPFNEAAYAKVPFDFESFLEPDFLHSKTFQQLDPNSHMWAADRPYRFKRLHLVSLNKLRNLALAEGKQLAEWTLVLDGSCFLTGDAWAQIFQAAQSRHAKHLILPMVRLIHNEQLFLPESIPPPAEEPHIAIHRDSQETYDEALHYGRFNKVEFLKRIQFPGVWDSWNYKPWEKKQWRISPEAGQWKQAGWVARLTSGHALDCDQTIEGMTARTLARQEAVWQFIDKLDEKIFRRQFHPHTLLFFNQSTLDQLRQGWQEDEPRTVAIIQPLIQTVKTGSLSTSDLSIKADGRPLQTTMAQATVLALTAYVTGHAEYADQAATLVREDFLASSTQGLPIHHTQGFYYFLDALRLLRHSEAWTETDHQSMQACCQSRLTWLGQSPQGQAENCSNHHHATGYDLQVASLTGFLDDAKTLIKTLEYSKLRIANQFHRDGSQPHELECPSSLQGCSINLQLWAILALMGDRLGIDIGHYTTQEGQNLKQACQWLLPYYQQPWPYEQRTTFNVKRLLPLYYMASEHYPLLPEAFSQQALPTLDDAPSVFLPDSGISPYWMFALKRF